MNINDLGKEQGSPMDGQNQKASSQEAQPRAKTRAARHLPEKSW